MTIFKFSFQFILFLTLLKRLIVGTCTRSNRPVEAVLTSTHKIFVSEQNKEKMHTPINSSSTI